MASFRSLSLPYSRLSERAGRGHSHVHSHRHSRRLFRLHCSSPHTCCMVSKHTTTSPTPSLPSPSLCSCCCCRKVIQPKTKPAPNSLDSEKPPLTVKPLPTIHEVEEPATTPRSQPQRRRTGSQGRRARIPSDQEELIKSEEGDSQPPSPIETTPTAPQPPPPQPIQQTPDPRKKKAPPATPQQTPPVAREPPRLPGAASPLEKNTPEPQRKEMPHLKPTTTELPPLRNTPPVTKKHTGPEAAAYDYYSSRLAPIQREPNKRLESPRMQQRRKQLTTPTSPSDIAMASLSKRGGDLSDSSAEDLGAFVSQLNIDEEFQTPVASKKKKTHLDTSELFHSSPLTL